MRGRWPSHKPLPTEVAEFLISTETGWNLGQIRAMPAKDFRIFSKLSLIYYNLAPRNQKINF